MTDIVAQEGVGGQDLTWRVWYRKSISGGQLRAYTTVKAKDAAEAHESAMTRLRREFRSVRHLSITRIEPFWDEKSVRRAAKACAGEGICMEIDFCPCKALERYLA